MVESLKELMIALGILLGILSPQSDPQLNVKIYKTTDRLFFSLEIEQGINQDITDLILAGNPVQVEIKAFTGSNREMQQQVTHLISYDPAAGAFLIYNSYTGQSHRTTSQTAAFAIFTGFYNIPLMTTAQFNLLPQQTIELTAGISLPEPDGIDPAVLWHYRQPQWKAAYKSLKEIPY